MAGHSKWAQIKHKKAHTDAKRGKLFAKLIRAVEVAARDAGTSNPENSMTLASAVERAKSYSVPGDTIDKAAKRGAGELAGTKYERVLYEGYGPSGVAILVESLTDNRNRTGADVRAVFSRGGGTIGEPGSVAYMFDRKGLIVLPGHLDEDQVLLAAADAGADDVTPDGGTWQVVCEVKDFASVRRALEAAGLPIETADLTMLPTTSVSVGIDAARTVLRLLDALEDLDDVQNVFANVDVPEELLAEVS